MAEQASLRSYAAVPVRRWPWVVVPIVVAVVAALAYVTHASKTYDARAEVRVEDPRSQAVFDQPRTGTLPADADRDLQTQVQIIDSDGFRSDVGKRLGQPSIPASRVTVHQITGTSVIQVAARGSHPKDAERTANAFVDLYLQ